MTRTLITGITGQDGSYLAEHLLERGHTVFGVTRRASTDNTKRIHHLKGKVTLIEGEIADQNSVNDILDKVRPDYLYNLAAQSHVGTSFNQPEYTMKVTGIAPMYMLDWIYRNGKTTKFYQASSSEMFGRNVSHLTMLQRSTHQPFSENAKTAPVRYQNEKTPFAPQSPYAVAKVAAHNFVEMYRERGVHATAGILFNHECFVYDTPVIVKDGDTIDIITMFDLAVLYADFTFSDNKGGTVPSSKIQIWDNDKWTDITCISWFQNVDKNINIINARNAIYTVTDEHVCFLDSDDEIEAVEMCVGDKVKLGTFCTKTVSADLTEEDAELLGMLVGDGYISRKGQFTNKDEAVRNRFAELWVKCTGGHTKYYPSVSGFTGKIVGRLDLYGGKEWLKQYNIYSLTHSVFDIRYKKVPVQILNADTHIMNAFLVGYNACDGLKSNKCKYEFKNFKTNSPVLAQGLLYLIYHVTGQSFNITVEESDKHSKNQLYYSINLLTPIDNDYKAETVLRLLNDGYTRTEIGQETGYSKCFIAKVANGKYLPDAKKLYASEVKKIISLHHDGYHNNWLFDIETSTGTLTAGIGLGKVHNSPRRGAEFVTRKITKWIAGFISWMYAHKLQSHWHLTIEDDGDDILIRHGFSPAFRFPKLRLGNIHAYRDWGHAREYTQAMIKIIEHPTPKSFVVGTGETYSVSEFLRYALLSAKIPEVMHDSLYVIDEELYRPCEVDYLCSHPWNAAVELGWRATIKVPQLAEEMVQADLKEVCQECLESPLNIKLGE